MDRRFYARSASDKTDNWPFWFVADSNKGGLNVTGHLLKKKNPETHKPGAVFMESWDAVKLAMWANLEAQA